MRPAKLLWAISVGRFPLGLFFFFFPRGICHRPQYFLTENPLFVPFALEKELLSEFKFSQLFCDDTE